MPEPLVGMLEGATPAPYQEHVHLDRDWSSEASVLTNTLTAECAVVDLPFASDCEMLFDEGGFGVICSHADGADPLLMDDLMRRKVVILPGGDLQLVQLGLDGQIEDVQPLDDLPWKFEIGVLTALQGPLRTPVQMDMSRFQTPRLGFVYWFSLSGLYGLADPSLTGTPLSRHLHKKLVRWEGIVKSLGFEGHIMRSKPLAGAAAASQAEHGLAGPRALPFVATSTAGMLLLLSAWAFAPTHRGGMQKLAKRDAASALLQAVLDLLLLRPEPIPLFLGRPVVFQPPRPAQGICMVRLPVSVLGQVTFEPFQDLAELPAGRVSEAALALAGLIADHCIQNENQDHCSVMDLVEAAWEITARGQDSNILQQVIHALAAQLDALLVRASADPDGGLLPAGCCVAIQGFDSVGSDYKADRLLMMYVASAQQHFKDGKMHSVTVDKSRVGNLGIQDGMICDDTNKAARLVPQVIGYSSSRMKARRPGVRFRVKPSGRTGGRAGGS